MDDEEGVCARTHVIRARMASVTVDLEAAALPNTFFTIGHSTRTIDKFVDLLPESGTNFVIDIKSMPRSRTSPQFNQQT